MYATSRRPPARIGKQSALLEVVRAVNDVTVPDLSCWGVKLTAEQSALAEAWLRGRRAWWVNRGEA